MLILIDVYLLFLTHLCNFIFRRWLNFFFDVKVNEPIFDFVCSVSRTFVRVLSWRGCRGSNYIGNYMIYGYLCVVVMLIQKYSRNNITKKTHKNVKKDAKAFHNIHDRKTFTTPATCIMDGSTAVSYTHLTLPTICSV